MGASSQKMAFEVGVTAATVGKWRKRFIEAGLGGLADGERCGRPKVS
jgi:transposase